MLWNLLSNVVSPDNKPGISGGINIKPLLILLMAFLAILVTIVFACMIIYLYRRIHQGENTKVFTITMLIITIIICALQILMCTYAM